MHRHLLVASLFVGTVAVAAVTARSPVAGTEAAALRAAVARSLPLLQSSADTWFARRQCASCHHQGLGLIATTIARERGFAVDESLVHGQLERTLQPRRNWHELFVTGEASINEAIGQSYRAVGVGTAGGTATAMTDAMSYLLAGRQHESGRWPSYSRRPPLEDSEVTATALTIRALRLFPLKGRQAEFDARIARARAWLTTVRPADTEDRAMQLLGLAWAGVPAADLARLADALIAEQRRDGGWSQIATRASDAYATGEAIVALNQAGRVPLADASLQRGLAYLVEMQRPDGSWRVPTRRTWREGLPYFESGYPHGPDQFISFAGSAWATTALALGVRDERSPALMGQPPARTSASPESGHADGLTTLMRAALYGTVAELDALLAAGQDVNATSPDGITALMCAVHDPEKVKRLLDAGANPAAQTREGHTALLLAAGYSGARGSVDQLLARGAPVDRPVTGGNFPGATALARAIARGDAGVASVLVEHGANVNGVVAGKMSPLVVATWHGDTEMVAWLLGHGTAVDAPFSDDYSDESTALMIAAEDGRPELVGELLARGADVNKADHAGYSALLYAALTTDRGTTDVVDRLLKAGARRSATAPDGLPAAGVARKWGKPHVAARIEQR
ncbi:MAG: ankyrin repeat domain-containing protein [Vicinamibacteria bacterium]|nr:ankyrin repeat domain-containing protein [Vicinamibacteria bacterium]